MDLLNIFLILAVAILGSTFAGIAGFGGGIIIMPILTLFLGPEAALPVLCLYALYSSISRAFINRRYINWQVNIYFMIGSIPMVIIGTSLFISLDPDIIRKFLGGFIFIIVLSKYFPGIKTLNMQLWAFIPLGGTTAFISGLIGIPGPFAATFFVNYGLTKHSLIGTFAFATALLNLPKLGVLAINQYITMDIVYLGTAIGLISVIASYIGNRILHKVSDKIFTVFINLVLLFFAGYFIID